MKFIRKNSCVKYAIGLTGLLYFLQLTVLPIGHAFLHLEDSEEHHGDCELEHTIATYFNSDCHGPCQNPDHDHHSNSSHSSENCSVCKTIVFAAPAKDFHRYVEVDYCVANPIIDEQLLVPQTISFHSHSRAPPILLS